MLRNIFDLHRLKKEKELHPILFKLRMISMMLFITAGLMICFESPIIKKVSDLTGLSIAMSGFLFYLIPTILLMHVNHKSRKLLGIKINDNN